MEEEVTVFVKKEFDMKDPLELSPLEFPQWKNKQGQVNNDELKLLIYL